MIYKEIIIEHYNENQNVVVDAVAKKCRMADSLCNVTRMFPHHPNYCMNIIMLDCILLFNLS